MASQKVLEHYLMELRKIEEHREKWCEQNVRKYYKDLVTDLQSFLGNEYAALAQDDKLTYEILHQKGQYARFVEEVLSRVDKISAKADQSIISTVKLTYQKCYEGMVDAVMKSKNYADLKANLSGVRAITPEQVKNIVTNSVMEQALEKNHKASIREIKQQLAIGLSQGDRMTTMAKRLSEQCNRDYKKSVNIIRTEAHRVREAGYQDASERMGKIIEEADSGYVMTKTWKTMGDGAVRPQRLKGKKGSKIVVIGKGPNHMKMNNVTILVNEEFDLGDGVKTKAPGQSGVAGHDCNCRCYLSRDLMTVEEFEKLTGRKIDKQNPAKKLEKQEQALVDEQEQLEQEKEKLLQAQTDLESIEYKGIWKDDVTVKDYSVKKDKIQAKRDYYNDEILAATNRTGKYANTLMYSDADLNAIIAKNKKFLQMLDDFEVQGKTYLANIEKLSKLDDKIIDLKTQIDAIKFQKAKYYGIDLQEMQNEIDELKNKLQLKSKEINDSVDMEDALLNLEFDDSTKYNSDFISGLQYYNTPHTKEYLDDKLNTLKLKQQDKPLSKAQQKKLDKLENFINETNKIVDDWNNAQETLKSLEQELKKKRLKLISAKEQLGIDLDLDEVNILHDVKISEINGLVNEISKMKKPIIDKDFLEKINYDGWITGWDYHIHSDDKSYVDDKIKLLKQKKNLGSITDAQEKSLNELEKFVDDYNKIVNSSIDTKKIKELEKQLKDKQTELDTLTNKYKLSTNAFSSEVYDRKHKDAAYWFTDDNGGPEAADKIVRAKCGEVWRNATPDQKNSAYEYTRSFNKYNEPLRGIEYGTSKFVGVGNIDLENVGTNGYGYKKGEVKKLIDDLTDIIDKSSYDHDMWFQRGCDIKGMDKFFNIDASDFNLSEEQLAVKLLGKQVTEHAFMSTAVSKGKGFNSKPIILNIYAPRGTKMLYVEPFSEYGANGVGKKWDGISTQSYIGSEAEMLFQRNTTFRITKVKMSNGKLYVDLDVINQER